MCGSLLVQSGYVARVQTRLKSIHQPGRVMGGGNLRRISRGRAFSRSRKMVFSYRLDDASPVERERSSSVRSFRGREMKKRKKKRKKRHESRGDGSCSSFMRCFFLRFFFTTKVNVTNGRRSIGLNDLVLWKLVLSPRCERRQKSGG